MLSFFIGAALGILQLFLLKAMFGALQKKMRGRVFLLFMLKSLIYGIAIALLMFKFNSHTENIIYGFIAAFPLGAVLMFVYTLFSKQINSFISFAYKKTKHLLIKK